MVWLACDGVGQFYFWFFLFSRFPKDPFTVPVQIGLVLAFKWDRLLQPAELKMSLVCVREATRKKWPAVFIECD